MPMDADWACFTQPRGPGGIVVGYTASDVLAWRSWGTAQPDGENLDLNSTFYAGSIAKQFTAAWIAELVLAGDLTLHSPVRNVTPDRRLHE